jgi:hypothetical protein
MMSDNWMNSPYLFVIFIIGTIAVVGLMVATGAFLRWAGYGVRLKRLDEQFSPIRQQINHRLGRIALNFLHFTSRSFNRRR